jgi:hypothetical protein
VEVVAYSARAQWSHVLVAHSYHAVLEVEHAVVVEVLVEAHLLEGEAPRSVFPPMPVVPVELEVRVG